MAMMLFCLFAYAQMADRDVAVTDKQHFKLRYIINTAKLDSSFVDNSERMLDMKEFLAQVAADSLVKITGIDFRGTASPDGGYEFNVWLSENRLRTLKELVRSYADVPDSLINAQSGDIPWDEFRAAVADDPDVPMKETVLGIIDEGPGLVSWWGGRHIDPRLLKLKKLSGGKVWDYLRSPILFNLRYGEATFYYARYRNSVASVQILPPHSLN